MLRKATVVDTGMMMTVEEINQVITDITVCLRQLDSACNNDVEKIFYFENIKKDINLISVSVMDIYIYLADKYRND